MKNKLKFIIPIVIAVIAIIIAALCIDFTPAEKADISSLISTAQKYLIENNYEQAIAEFNKIINLDPMNVEAYIGIAKACEKNNDKKQAMEWLEKGYALTGDISIKLQIELLQKLLNYKIPKDAVVYNGHSYYIYSNWSDTWEAAEEFCESLGGHLAVIDNSEENYEIYNIMKYFGYDSSYFGYTDLSEGDWKWVCGNSTYENWGEGEPNNYGSNGYENYAMFYHAYNYTWNDGDGIGKFNFICEWDIEGEECQKNDALVSNTESNIETAVEYVIVEGYCIPTNIFALEIVGPDKEQETTDMVTDEENHIYRLSTPLSDISFISKFKNLTYLKLELNEISDLEPLGKLSNLTYLDLHYNDQIRDISYICNLTNLTYLNLSKNQINDISALKNLTNLTYLSLSDNQISNISAISGLINLNDLHLGNNKINDISPLNELNNLNALNLMWNQISDISPLSGLTNLTVLLLQRNQISDISFLSKLTNLTCLNFDNNKVSDISSLSMLTHLNELSMAWNQISNISSILELNNLTFLKIYSNQISDADIRKLEESLANCDIDS